MSEKTQRFSELFSAFSAEILKFIDNFSIWLLPPVVFIFVFIGNTFWGLPGVFISLIISFVIMSFMYYFIPKKNHAISSLSFPPSDQSGISNQHQSSSGPQVSIRTTMNRGDRYSPRPTSHNEVEPVGSLLPLDTSTFESMRSKEDDLECEDSSTIAERLGSSGIQKKSLSPSEWSAVASPGFSSRVIRQAMGHSPLRDSNFKGFNRSPFQMSPNGNLKLGEIPYGSKWRLSRRSPTQFRFPAPETHLLSTSNSISRHREPKENGTVYLKIAPIEGISQLSNSARSESSETELSSENSKMLGGLGGISQTNLNGTYSRLSTSANCTLEKTLRLRSSSPPNSSTPNIAEALANRKGKRIRGHDSTVEQSLNTRNSPAAVPSNLNLSLDENPKDSKRVKFIIPNEPNTSRNLSMLPLTSHNNPENVNMTSESILEQMNQTEKRFLPDDDTPPSIRPLPKKNRSIDRISHGSHPTPSSPVPSSYRKRKASTTAFSMVEETRKAPRYCNCSECYEEAAGVPTLDHSLKKIEKPDVLSSRKIMKTSTCDRATETEFVPAGSGNTRFSSHLSLALSKERYYADKKQRTDRLQKMLDISFKKSATVVSTNAEVLTPFTTANSSITTVASSVVPTISFQRTDILNTNQPSVNQTVQNQNDRFTDIGDSKFGSSQLQTNADAIKFGSGTAVTPLPEESKMNNSSNDLAKQNITQTFKTDSGKAVENSGLDSVVKSVPSSTFVGFGSVGQDSLTPLPTSQADTAAPKINFGSTLQNNVKLTENIIGGSEQENVKGSTTGLFSFGSSGSTKPSMAGDTPSRQTFGDSSVPGLSLPTDSSIFGKSPTNLSTPPIGINFPPLPSMPVIPQDTTPQEPKLQNVASGGSVFSTGFEHRQSGNLSSTGMTFGNQQLPSSDKAVQPQESGIKQLPFIFGGQNQSSVSEGSKELGSNQSQKNASVTSSLPVNNNPGGFSFNSSLGTNTSSLRTENSLFGNQQGLQPGAGGLSFGTASTLAASPSPELFQFGQPSTLKDSQAAAASPIIFGSTTPSSTSVQGLQTTTAPMTSNLAYNQMSSGSYTKPGSDMPPPISKNNSSASSNLDAAGGHTFGGSQVILPLKSDSFAFIQPQPKTNTSTTGGFSFGDQKNTSVFGAGTGISSGFGLKQQEQSDPSKNMGFGTAKESVLNSPAGGAFGLNQTRTITNPSAASTNSSSTFGFGTQPTGSTSPFLFGSTTPSKTIESTPTTTTPFGFGQTSQTVSGQGTPSFSFWNQNQTSSAGSTTPANVNSSFGFGNQQLTSSGAKAGTGVFGSQSLGTTTANVFGSQNQLNASSASSGNVFGNQPLNSPGLFGAQSQSLSTPTTAASVFGSPSNAIGGFGGQQQNVPTFGSPAVFGSQQQNTTFGSPQQNVSGTASPSGFGFNQANSGTGTGGFGFGAQQTSGSTGGFSFGSTNNSTALPNNANNSGGLFQFGQPTQQPQIQSSGFNFGAPNSATPAQAGNQMFTLGASTTPRRRDTRARRYR